MKTFKVVNTKTGKSFQCELSRETKCYYIMTVSGVFCKPGEFRFHKNTLTNGDLLLIVEEAQEEKIISVSLINIMKGDDVRFGSVVTIGGVECFRFVEVSLLEVTDLAASVTYAYEMYTEYEAEIPLDDFVGYVNDIHACGEYFTSGNYDFMYGNFDAWARDFIADMQD